MAALSDQEKALLAEESLVLTQLHYDNNSTHNKLVPVSRNNYGCYSVQCKTTVSTGEVRFYLFRGFKEKAKDYIQSTHEDGYLFRWIKAQKMDVGKAVGKFKTAMDVRAEMKLDTILNDYEPPQVIRDYLAGGFSGFDKQDCLVSIELLGHLDMRGLMCAVKRSDIERAKFHQCELVVRLLKEQAEKVNRPAYGMTVIIDMDKVGYEWLWRPGVEMYVRMVNILEDNYPDIVKRLYIVNAARVFPLLWKLGRPFLSDDMKRKVQVLGSNFKEVLLKDIDADQLPAFLGGTLTDPDGNTRCTSKICQGGKVPESLYLAEGAGTDHLQSIEVPHGDKFRLDFKVVKPGSVLRWEFRTEDYDIGFGVFQKPAEESEKEVEVVPQKRVPSHTIMEDGSIICTDPGTYEIVFDNTFSWARGKKLHYHVEVLASEDTDKQEVDKITSGGSWETLESSMKSMKL